MTTTARWIQAGQGPQGDSYLGYMERPVRLKNFEDHFYLSEMVERLKTDYYRRGQQSVLQLVQRSVDADDKTG